MRGAFSGHFGRYYLMVVSSSLDLDNRGLEGIPEEGFGRVTETGAIENAR
jgi:hypothetical protein